MKKNNRRNVIGLLAIVIPILFSILQLFLFYPRGYIVLGDDTHFHLTRILGLAQSLKNNSYPFFINTAFLNGFGYASNWFYPDIFILPMSFLMNLGVHLIHIVKSYYIILSLWQIAISSRPLFK